MDELNETPTPTALPQSETPKKPYTPPAVAVHGSVAEITQASGATQNPDGDGFFITSAFA